MQRPSRKQFWVWAVSVLMVLAIVCSLPGVRVQYHKSRLESLKDRKARLLANKPSTLDRFWLKAGTPISGAELDSNIRNHEDALVELGFLKQTKLPAQMVAACPETLETLKALDGECPWYHAETMSGTNFVVTACPRMMQRWRERAKELGWQLPERPNSPAL
jgi:hypothetical protein